LPIWGILDLALLPFFDCDMKLHSSQSQVWTAIISLFS
jgi:hypothetical protein